MHGVLRRSMLVAGVMIGLVASSAAMATGALADDEGHGGRPNFGSNVYVFTPSTPQSRIQATADAIAAQQLHNEFGPQRYAMLFAPGTYGSPAHPLNFQVGYYTTVAGLGLRPNDVTINGSVDVYNQCPSAGFCHALNNFWRSLSNLTINVVKLNAGCYSNEFWAVSQAAPLRRVQVHGTTTLMDYCTGPSFASGGFIADSGMGSVINGSQQQWFTRNSSVGGWSNAVWNQTFSGVIGAPPQSFPTPPYTTLPTSPTSREAPFLYQDSAGKYNVFKPAVQHNSVGPTWTAGPTPGSSLPLSRFYIARPGDSAGAVNRQLASGKNLLLTPGIYHLSQPLRVSRHDTVVLGIGFPTLVPTNGNLAMSLRTDVGVLVSGLIIDAGPRNSPVLLQVGAGNGREDDDANAGGDGGDNSNHGDSRLNPADDPNALTDVFFRIGGATPGRATRSLLINSNYAVLDDVWAWRADHGNGVGWTLNRADTGLIVNGNNVTAQGLFVEHYQKYEVIWNGDNGTDVFFQNEMPYDPPSQAAWNEGNGVLGWPAFKVANQVTQFDGHGMGSYSFFNKGPEIFATRAFEVPYTLPLGSMQDLLTVFLDPNNGHGGILHVINNTGASSTKANPDVPVTVNAYPPGP